MPIQQISVFLENRQGALEELTASIAKGGVDMIAMSIADTTDFGILRAIVDDTEKALQLAKEKGFTASITDVLAVAVPDEPGGISGALRILRQCGVSIEYVYSFMRRIEGSAIIIFRVDDPQRAEEALRNAGFTLLPQEQITCKKEPC